mgnify:CR=1 FL=1
MHIAVVHGYLLRGTGSNLFTQNLCREFCRLGHRVSLFCQEPAPQDFDFVSCAFEFEPQGDRPALLWERGTPYAGKCDFYRPLLSGPLPVYVYDHYRGFTVKEYPDLTPREIETYIECNRRALASVFAANRPDLVLSQHLIMQPVYAARALRGLGRCRHYLTVHGSALNFSVRRSTLLRDYAREALTACDRVVCVSEAGREELLSFFSHDRSLEEKTAVIPVGVDVSLFSPLAEGESKASRLRPLLEGPLRAESNGDLFPSWRRFLSQAVAEASDAHGLASLLESARKDLSGRETDPEAVRSLSAINWERDAVVLYHGKFLWTKGAQLLLAAAPLVWQRHPSARFILVGFGTGRAHLEALAAALEYGRRELFVEMLSRPDLLEPGADPGSSLYARALLDMLAGGAAADDYFTAARGRVSDGVIFTGYLDHEQLKYLLPCAEVATAPSIFPEAFGLVAVEALSSGIIPLLANHSGFKEVIREVVEEFSDTFEENRFKPLFLDEELALSLAKNISAFLDHYSKMDEEGRRNVRLRAHRIAQSRYSWSAVASSYLSL